MKLCANYVQMKKDFESCQSYDPLYQLLEKTIGFFIRSELKNDEIFKILQIKSSQIVPINLPDDDPQE